MNDLEKQSVEMVKEEEVEVEVEEERLIKGMAVLDFDLLCSAVALQTEGKWRNLGSDDFDAVANSGVHGDEFGGVFRMWEGEVLDCFNDRRIAIESLCCPCYRFGKNMKRAGFGSCFLQGTVLYVLALSGLLNFLAFIVSKKYCFLYLTGAFSFSTGMYLGFFRVQMRKKFNIEGSDSYLDDYACHLCCPCCALCQESRTMEMNNVQNGVWHGRGDTICIGSYIENKPAAELQPPSIPSTLSQIT